MGEKSNEAEGKKECAEGAAGNEIYRAPKLMQDAVQACGLRGARGARAADLLCVKRFSVADARLGKIS